MLRSAPNPVRTAFVVLLSITALAACGKNDAKNTGANSGGAKKNEAPAPKPATPKPADKPAAVDGTDSAAQGETAKSETAKPETAKAEAGKPAEPSAVQTAKKALEGATAETAQPALKTLRTWIDNNPKAEDLAEAAKLLVNTSLEQAAAAAKAGDVEKARAFAAVSLGDDGKLSKAVAAGLVMGRTALEDAAILISKAGMDDLDALADMAGGDSKGAPAAKALHDHYMAKIVAAFPSEGTGEARYAAALAAREPGEWSTCPDARKEGAGSPQTVCAPEFYGLETKEALAAVPAEALPVLRLKALAAKAGDKAPTGVVELPVPEHEAAEVTRTSAETASYHPIEQVLITEQGVHLVTRPVVQLESKTLVSGEAWPGKPVLTVEQLDAVEKPEDLQPLVDALQALRTRAATAEATVYGAEDKRINATREKGKWSIEVAAKAAPVKRLGKVLQALETAGYGDIRYGRADGEPLAAPTTAAWIPAERAGRVESQPIIVEVTEEGASLYPPRGEGEAPVETEEIALPAQAKRWYKGTRVFKIDVSGADVGPVVQTLRAMRQEHKAGTVVTVTGAAEVPAERVLQVTAAIADATGPAAQTKLSEVFPGVACKDEEATLESDACRSLFPVVPPAVDVPRSGGLTDAPVKPEKKVAKPKAKPVEQPKEKPKMGFCNKSDIARVIKSRTGAIKFCYERRLQLNQDLAGRVAVRLTIGSSGSVVSATSSGSMPDKKVHSCILKAIRKLNFKPPEGGGSCVVSYPFKFQP